MNPSYLAASGGLVGSQVQRAYNGLGQLTAEYQAHGAAVDPATTPKVQYAYSALDAANRSRLVSVTYPNGRVVANDYGPAGQLNDAISRLGALTDGGTTLEGYAYLGLGTVVTRSHPQPGIDLTYVKRSGEAIGDAGDQYTGTDRFGRVVDQRWVVAATGVAADRFGYTLDRDGNRLTRTNGVNAAFGEAYTYDGLNQVANFARGAHTQAWNYDALGNWSGVTTDGTTQTRTANAQNEITAISGATTPTYDANGNMTTDETGRQFAYDAWNRLKVVKSSGGVVLETLGYDAISRRITAVAGTTTDLYYSANWQVLEERVGGVAKASYVWSPVYVDSLVARDRDADGSAGNGLEERLYALADANYNVTALVSMAGVVVERYAYDPFGKASVLDAGFAAKAGGTGYGWVVLFQGLRRDGVSGLDYARNRDYSPALGRWVTMDPIGFKAGDVNLYRDQGNNVVNYVDPSGLYLPAACAAVAEAPAVVAAATTPPGLVIVGGITLTVGAVWVGGVIGDGIVEVLYPELSRPVIHPPVAAKPRPKTQPAPSPIPTPKPVPEPTKQTCDDARHEELKRIKNSVCNKFPGERYQDMSPDDLAKISCDDFYRRLVAFISCRIARNNVTNECFGGIVKDKGHKQQDDQIFDTINLLMKLYSDCIAKNKWFK